MVIVYMVAGIGVDIADIKRIREALADFGERFRNRIFTETEIAYCEQFTHKAAKLERYAARLPPKKPHEKPWAQPRL